MRSAVRRGLDRQLDEDTQGSDEYGQGDGSLHG